MSDREDFKVYVGNLNYNVTEDDVRDHFEEFGRVEEVFIATDRYTRRPRGYCFVTFRKSEHAKEAIRQGDKSMLANREINVHRALPKRSSRYDDQRHRRSPSPRRRSRSPRRRSPSPRRRSPSPRRRSPSPRRQSLSPRKRSLSPRKRSLSPRKRSLSPKRRSISPRRSNSASPRCKSASPN